MSTGETGSSSPAHGSNGLVPLPTMRDVADHLGVSRQLVSMVLRGVPGPSAESRDRILSAARELGYRPNASARLLNKGRTNLIGVVFGMRNPFQVRFVERLFTRSADEGFGLVLGPITEERSTDVVLAQLLEERVEGLIVFNPDPDAVVVHEAMKRVPVVLLGEWVEDAAVDNVHVDETSGFEQAVDHLVGLGHRSITYFGGSWGTVGADRAAAYESVMRARGLVPNTIPSDFSEEGGAAAAATLLALAASERPTAVICSSDQCATGALAVLTGAGLTVPEDLSLVGFDDSYLASLSYQQLTSIHQDVDATVEAALGSVLERITTGGLTSSTAHRISTPTRLAQRRSTGVPAREPARPSA